MAREHGWGPAGARVYGSRPGRSWKTLTLIGAIRKGRRPQLMTHHGSVTGRVFLRYVKTRLAPWLQRGDIVVMDNLGAHKMRSVRMAIEAVGASVVYLPTYSPDMNPIELWWPNLKRRVRTEAPRDVASLARCVRRIRSGTQVANVNAWIDHALSFAQVNRSLG